MKYVSFFILLVVLASCKKPHPADPEPIEKIENSMLVLCEGLFQHNNSSVTLVDFATNASQTQFFETQTGRSLGDTGNDMKRYGGKIYVVVNVSSTIEVMNAGNFKSVKQIEMFANGQPKEPRSIAFSGGYAYVSCYDGFVDVIDTATLTVTQRIPVGANPEGLAVSNNKLYVANSGGLNYPNVDSTVSVIDLPSNIELQKITVGNNPGSILVNESGDVFVIARGNYGTIPSRLKRIDPATDQVVDNYSFDISGMTSYNADNMLVYNASGISRFNFTSNGIAQSNFVDISGVQTLYGVEYNPNDDGIYVLDAMSYVNLGYVYKYSTSGNLLKTFNVGLNPSKIVFYD